MLLFVVAYMYMYNTTLYLQSRDAKRFKEQQKEEEKQALKKVNCGCPHCHSH